MEGTDSATDPTDSATDPTDLLLRTLRVRSGLTLRQLARRCDITAGYLSRVERGLQSAPPQTVSRIADEIGRYQAEGRVA